MATKRKGQLTDADRTRIREIAIQKAISEINEATGFVGTIGSFIPGVAPFAKPTSSAVRRSANLLLKSGALDSYINAQINMLASQRGYVISDVENKSRADIVMDLAEAGIDILADPEIQKELMNLDRAIENEGGLFPKSIRRQFSRANIVGGINLEETKRTRKKTKTDKNMSKALREANSKLRTKNGKLRKGKTMRDVMKLAHRMRKKMR